MIFGLDIDMALIPNERGRGGDHTIEDAEARGGGRLKIISGAVGTEMV